MFFDYWGGIYWMRTLKVVKANIIYCLNLEVPTEILPYCTHVHLLGSYYTTQLPKPFVCPLLWRRVQPHSMGNIREEHILGRCSSQQYFYILYFPNSIFC